MRWDAECPRVLDRHLLWQREGERPGLLSGELGSRPEALLLLEKDIFFLPYEGRASLDLEAREQKKRY